LKGLSQQNAHAKTQEEVSDDFRAERKVTACNADRWESKTGCNNCDLCIGCKGAGQVIAFALFAKLHRQMP